MEPIACSVSTSSGQRTTKAGLIRQRMKWTTDVNIFIMTAYYTITNLESDKTAYRQTLHEQFTQKYPEYNATVQRVADQRRVIVTNNLLPLTTLQNIRERVVRTLNTTSNDTTINPINQTHSETLNDLNTDSQSNTNISTEYNEQIDPILLEKLKTYFNEALSRFTNIDPTERPRIPKLYIKKNTFNTIEYLNKHILPSHLETLETIDELHTAIYCAATTVVRHHEIVKQPQNKDSSQTSKTPGWERRLERQIDNLRKDLGRLTQYSKNNRSAKLLKNLSNIFEKIGTHSKHEKHNKHITEYIDTLKQKLAAKTGRLKRYKDCTKRKRENKSFYRNEKQFYRSLFANNTQQKDIKTPTENALTKYWSSIWDSPIEHNKKATWIEEQEKDVEHVPNMDFEGITQDELAFAIKYTHNWKTPGIDGIQCFWYKRFTSTHTLITTFFNHLLEHPEETPAFLTQGITYMIPKDTDTQDPSKFRPITCLPTLYKIFTSCITNKIYTFIEENNLLSEEQKGCRKRHKGCKEQLIIDSVILEQAFKKHRNLFLAFIDYLKAFDSVPHSWLIHILRLYKIHPTLIAFLETLMKYWRTTLHLKLNNTNISTKQINIRRGIFQGDSLSLLWFCLALNPLSNLLNKSQLGYPIKDKNTTSHTLTHLLYVDDLKLYAKSAQQLEQLLGITERFSKDIGMEFGISKCKTLCINRGKIEKIDYKTDNDKIITHLNETETYKYLGIQQAKRIDHKQIKQTLTNTYFNRIKAIAKTKLNSKNKFKAFNTFAIPILTYSFGIIKWTHTDIKHIEIKTRTTLTKFNMHHPKSAIERVTLQRKEGGRGLVDITNLHYTQIKKLRDFFFAKQETSPLHLAVAEADNKYTPLNLSDSDLNTSQYIIDKNTKILNWEHKELHGRYAHDLKQPQIDTIASHKWLAHGDLFSETEGFMLAIQDKVIKTKNYRKHILKDSTLQNDKCRKCHRSNETIEHITSGCTLLTQTDYLHRHNQLANIIHLRLALKHKLLDNSTAYYKYIPQTVLENETHKMYYDRAIITDKTIRCNRPDITLIDKINKKTYIIDIAVPNANNILTTHTNKISKYTDLSHEIKHLWNMKNVYIIPIIMSTTGLVPKSLHTSLENIGLHKNTYIELQKAAILNTCRIVRKFLQIDTDGDILHL